MDLKENIRAGLDSIRSNKLRTILTASIIAIGITSLVSMLTAIDGIQKSINDSFSNLGANTFSVKSLRQGRGAKDGKVAQSFAPVSYRELLVFKEYFDTKGTTSVNTKVTSGAEVKHGSKVSNPNVIIQGGDADYLVVEGQGLDIGRAFTEREVQEGSRVALIGTELRKMIFDDGMDPIGKRISLLGHKFVIIGVLEEQGGSGDGGGADRTCLIPITTARRLAAGRTLAYEAKVQISDPIRADDFMGEAINLMRAIRKDPVKQENSFEVSSNQSLAERLGEITGYLRIGGFSVGFITLLGASIGLMNIMLVAVTERTREIGVRKALGATPLKIRRQFVIEALVICQLGGIAGIIFGILFGNIISRIVDGAFVIPWLWIIFGVMVGMVVGLISGFWPAYKASKLDPIDSLRFE